MGGLRRNASYATASTPQQCDAVINQMIDDRQELGTAGISHGLQKNQVYTNVTR